MAKTEPNGEEYNLKKPKARWCGVMRKAIGLVQRPMVKQELLPYRLSDRDHRSDAFTQAAFSWQGNAVPSALSFDTVSRNGLCVP
jgi:hypothetical protein